MVDGELEIEKEVIYWLDNFFIWYIWLKDLGWCKMFRIGYYCLNRMLLEWNFFKMYYVFVF